MKTRMGNMGSKGTIRGQRPPLGERRWSIQDNRGSQRPHKEPKGLNKAPTFGPMELYGADQ